MQLVVPEILADARGLSIGILVFGLFMGLFLWVFGWWSHRFWVVLTTTVLAGIYGLYEGTAFQAQPLAAALLLAIAAGVLALSLVRVLAFLAGGMAGLWAIQAAFPGVTQHVLCFLGSGLVGLFLFRLWMMAVTSLVGCLLAGYCGLTLLDRAGTMDAVEWTAHGAVLLNWLWTFLAVVGVLLQYLLDRRRRRKEEEDDEGSSSESWNPLKLRSWLDWQSSYRKAG